MHIGAGHLRTQQPHSPALAHGDHGRVSASDVQPVINAAVSGILSLNYEHDFHMMQAIWRRATRQSGARLLDGTRWRWAYNTSHHGVHRGLAT
jgi:hypothetical protein